MNRSSRTRLITIALLFVVVLTASCGRAPRTPPRAGTSAASPSPSSTSQAHLSAQLERELRAYYGTYLDSVEVSNTTIGTADRFAPPGTIGAEHPYVVNGVYRLKDLPLTFPFTFDPGTGSLRRAIRDGAYWDRQVLHEELGGVAVFYKLAKRYHRDFPQEPTMSYWLASDNQFDEQPPYDALLKGHPGRAVIVFQRQDYFADGMAKPMGLYWWDPTQSDWVLLQKDPADPR